MPATETGTEHPELTQTASPLQVMDQTPPQMPVVFSSPDEVIEPSSHLPPLEDFRAIQDLFKRMTSALNI